MEKVLFDIALILIFTKVCALISRRFKMPEVLGALIAGVLLGPVVLNLVPYDDNLKLLSHLGVIMLMFLAGIETNINEFKKAGLSSLVIAAGGVLIPLVLGTLGSYLFFQDFWGNIFVGIILTATSVSITVETLKELGKLNSSVGINILGAAVIDDILGLILIAVVFALTTTSGSDAGAAGLLPILAVFAKIIIFSMIAMIGVLWIPKYLNKYSEHKKPNKAILTFSIAVALLLAYLAESLGIAAITGAYVCGLMFSKYVYKEYLEKNIKAISSGFLSLIFFASVGIEANVKGITPNILIMTLLMFLIALAGKIVGCSGAARIMKISRRESIQIGVGMVSRGEVALITANIGLQNGIISDEIYLPTLIVVILTTIITPVLLKLSFQHRRTVPTV